MVLFRRLNDVVCRLSKLFKPLKREIFPYVYVYFNRYCKKTFNPFFSKTVTNFGLVIEGNRGS